MGHIFLLEYFRNDLLVPFYRNYFSKTLELEEKQINIKNVHHNVFNC